ncbi:hypothetical protein QAD02_021677 [Eretmocerus hayati]|uniref:Uncharacterized protein n=1 Tax=Eretmocerus hayati TaxID=131215 RepID=A0ACC2PQK7_9HYME|nr:hypothetical protein QAD02_021677 [Eretmocerus hayati]
MNRVIADAQFLCVVVPAHQLMMKKLANKHKTGQTTPDRNDRENICRNCRQSSDEDNEPGLKKRRTQSTSKSQSSKKAVQRNESEKQVALVKLDAVKRRRMASLEVKNNKVKSIPIQRCDQIDAAVDINESDGQKLDNETDDNLMDLQYDQIELGSQSQSTLQKGAKKRMIVCDEASHVEVMSQLMAQIYWKLIFPA